MLNLLANQGMTNAQSKTIVLDEEEKKVYLLPEEIMESPCVQFIVNGIDATERAVFVNTLQEYSTQLWVDYDLVLSAILGEQIRISCKGVRWVLKDTILKTTPMLFRSYDVSVWVAGLKLWTARRIRNDALSYGYWEDLKNTQITEHALIHDDVLSAKLATLLVKNIIHRWELSWFDISQNAWIVGTLYNMGNPPKKEPHADPKIWWSVIEIEGQEFTYGEISLAMYNYFKQQKETH